MTTPEPGGTPGTPVTEAGRQLLAKWRGAWPGSAMSATAHLVIEAVPRIEAEAARFERERLRVAIRAITGQEACFCEFDNRPGEEGLFVDRAAVLAILRDEP